MNSAALRIALATALLVSPALLADTFDSAPSKYVRGESGRIHYRSWGKGKEALVLVHGWTCDMQYFREQVNHFAPRTRVIAIDLPGHGGSDKPQIEYTQPLFARSIAAVLDDARVKRAVLAGHSMGMPVSRQFYRLDPARTAGIISLDGSVKAMITDPKVIESLLGRLRGPDYLSAATAMVDGMLAAAPASGYKTQIREVMLSTPQHVVAGAATGMFDLSFWNDDPIGVPLLLIHAPSPMWSDAYAEYARKLAPKLEYHMLEGVSHFLHTEKPAEVNALIDAWLARNRLLGR